MKVDNFAVSVQWGSGHHYFLNTEYQSDDEAYAAGNKAAKELKKSRARKNNRLKPTVYVWLRRYSIGMD